MTTIINLLAGSGCGKSTTGLGLAYELKSRGLEAELITEFVKLWAYRKKTITQIDQPFIFANQAKRESDFYNYVPWLVTDSPLILNPVYDEFYNGKAIMTEATLKFLEQAKNKDVRHVYYLLKRHKQFNPVGRYETADTAIKFDAFLEQKLKEFNIEYKFIECPDNERVATIIKDLGL